MWPECARDPEGLALLQAAVARPNEQTPRLVLADWLQERGEEEIAGIIRESMRVGEWVDVPDAIQDRWHPLNGADDGWLGISQMSGLPVFGNSSASHWLTMLELCDQTATSTGLKQLLPSLENLINLSLSGTRVTAAVLRSIASLQKLTALDLSRTPVTDERLQGLPALNNLRTLDLELTYLTDAGLNELVRLPNLISLRLAHTAVSDAGLQVLAALKGLTTLDLRWTRVTDAGRSALQQALPNCNIV